MSTVNERAPGLLHALLMLAICILYAIVIMRIVQDQHALARAQVRFTSIATVLGLQPSSQSASAGDIRPATVDDSTATDTVIDDQLRLFIDDLAGHPDDVPGYIAGVTDFEISEYDEDLVNELLSDEMLAAATLSDDPRHIFALGRVALIHGEEELAFDLLSQAAEADSAPAYAYLAEMFVEDDPVYALELAEESVALGFAPAELLWEEIDDLLGPTDDIAAITSPTLHSQTPATPQPQVRLPIDFSKFAQPELIQAFLDGNVHLAGIDARVPSSSPDFIASNPTDATLQHMIKTTYVCNLAIAFQHLANNESANPAFYNSPDTPLLMLNIKPDVASLASTRIKTEDMMVLDTVVNLGSGIVGLADIFGTVTNEVQKETFTVDSFMNILGSGIRADTRSKKLQELPNALWHEAYVDALRLQRLLYSGYEEEFQQVYRGISRFIARH